MSTLNALLQPHAAVPAPPAPEPVNIETPELALDVQIESISCDAVIGGCLMQIRFSGATNPAVVKPYLLALDPAAKVRDDFPARGFGAPRDCKTSRCLMVTLKKYNGNLSVEFICHGAEGDLTASPFRDNAEKIINALHALPQLSPASKAKIEQILASTTGNPIVPLVLQAEEQFGVKYWEKNGNHIADEITADAPALA